MATVKTKRLLYVGASPTGMDRVDVGQLGDIIRRELDRSEIEVFSYVACTWRDFERLLLEHDPHILHIGCHGADGAFYFLKSDNAPHAVSGEHLADGLSSCRRLQWIVLNTCSSAVTAEHLCGRYGIPVIGMVDDISSASCLKYTDSFYMNIAFKRGLEESHQSGARAIDVSCDDDGVDREGHIPKLYVPKAVSTPSASPRSASPPGELAESGAPPAGAIPAQSAIAERLRSLLEAHLADHLELSHALARALQLASADPATVTGAIMAQDVVSILRTLVEIARRAPSMRSAAQAFAQFILPAVVNWSDDTRARVAVAEDGPTIITLPFLNRPICEIAVAGLQGRPADLSCETGSKAALMELAGSHLPLRDQGQAMRHLIAEAVLRRAGLPFAHLRTKPANLIKQARAILQHNRDALAPADRYQMYLVFSSTEVGAMKAVHDKLPELWLVEGTGDEDDPRITLYLRELFEWRRP